MTLEYFNSAIIIIIATITLFQLCKSQDFTSRIWQKFNLETIKVYFVAKNVIC